MKVLDDEIVNQFREKMKFSSIDNSNCNKYLFKLGLLYRQYKNKNDETLRSPKRNTPYKKKGSNGNSLTDLNGEQEENKQLEYINEEQHSSERYFGINSKSKKDDEEEEEYEEGGEEEEESDDEEIESDEDDEEDSLLDARRGSMIGSNTKLNRKFEFNKKDIGYENKAIANIRQKKFGKKLTKIEKKNNVSSKNLIHYLIFYNAL